MKKIAMIGAGNIFETAHFPNFSNLEGYEITALVGSDKERIKEAANRFGVANFFTSTEEMLNICRPDIVSVATPNKFHYEAVMLALKYGCHVFCEKPPAITAEQARQMMESAESKNLVLAYNLNRRHSSDVGFLKHMIDDGALGRIYNVRACFLRRRGVPGWGNFTDRDMQGGGALIDLGVHVLDTALYLMGYPKVKTISAACYAEIGTKKNKGTLGTWSPEKFNVEDSAFAFITFENGASLTLETSFALNIKEKESCNVWLHGSEAGARVFPPEIYSDIKGELSDTTFPFGDKLKSTEHETSIKRFISRCEGKDDMIATGREGYMLQRILEDIYHSAQTGLPVVAE